MGETRKFKMPDETLAEKWHREATNENPVLTFLVGMAAGIVVAFVVVVLGGDSTAYGFYGKPDIINEVKDHEQVRLEPMVVGAPEEGGNEQPAEPQETVQGIPGDAEWRDPYYGYLDQGSQTEQELYNYTASYDYAPYQTQEPDGASLRFDGVQYSDDGTRYTWYSQNVLPGGGLDIPGRGVDENGFVVDSYGNLCVASSDHEKGTVLETPYGMAVVYDTGCATGTVDMYTNW